MSLSTWVQFLRNFACCCRALLPKDTWFIAKTMPLPYASFITILFTNTYVSTPPDPSYINYFIAITQFYVALVMPYYSFFKVIDGYKSMKLQQHYYVIIQRIQLQKPSTEGTLIENGIKLAINQSFYNKIIAGIVEIMIGFSFAFLGFGSLSIHLPHHPKPVIDALIVMEIGLMYALYFMYQTMINHRKNAIEAKALIDAVTMKLEEIEKNKDSHLIPTDIILLAYDVGFKSNVSTVIEALGIDYNFDWLHTIHNSHSIQSILSIHSAEEHFIDLEDEIHHLSVELQFIAKTSDTPIKASKVLGIPGAIQSRLLKYKNENASKVFMDFVYFALNLIAFYAYTLCILPFYFPERGVILNMVMFGLSDNESEFWGSLIGDLAWTIEPILIILTHFMTMIKSISIEKKTKVE